MRPASGQSGEFLKSQCHSFATLWKFTLTSGQVIRWCNHDRAIKFDGELYSPTGSPRASAAQEVEGLEGQSKDLQGVVETAQIGFDELRAGLLRNASVTEFTVDWRYPWAGALATRKYFVGEVRYGGNDQWNVELNNLATRLNVPVGSLYGRACRFSLGDSKCGVNENLFKSSLLAVTDVSTGSNNTRLQFSIDDEIYLNSKLSGFADFGIAEWISGKNIGLKTEILKETRPGSNEINFQLSENAKFDIQVGDTFIVTAGCDRTLTACENKFNNVNRFGGFPDIPGVDRLILTPNPR